MRFIYLDLLRAYAIFLVTGFHLWRFFGKPSLIFAKFDIWAPFRHGHFGVELFFALSGFCMALSLSGKKNISWVSYFKKRTTRIIPPYYVAIIIWTILVYFGVATKPISFTHQISHFLFLHTLIPNHYYSISGVFWSLSVEAHFYLVLPLIFNNLKKSRPIYIILFSLLLYLIGYMTQNFYFKSTFIGYILFFILGFLTHQNREKLYHSCFFSNTRRLTILMLCFVAILYLSFSRNYILNWHFHTIVHLLPYLLLLSYFSYKDIRLNFFIRKIAFTGKISYSVYLYNYIFYVYRVPFFFVKDEYLFIRKGTGFLFYFCLVYLFGWIMYEVFERRFSEYVNKFYKYIILTMKNLKIVYDRVFTYKKM